MFKTNDPAVRYSSKTLVGNWFEERIRQDALRQNQRLGKYALDLRETQAFYQGFEQQRLNASLKAALTFAPGQQSLRSGMKLRLESQQGRGGLCVDPLDARCDRKGATISLSQFAVRRNTFQVLKAGGGTGPEDGLIRLGDKVKVLAHQALFPGRAMYLGSCVLTNDRGAKVSGFQEAFFSPEDSYNALWEVQSLNLEARFKDQRGVVPLGAPVLLRHCATGRLLGTDTCYAVSNSFGEELEVFVENMSDRTKSQNLARERTGLKGPELVPKTFGRQNEWAFVPGSSPVDDFDETGPDAAVKRLIVLEELRSRFVGAGIYSFLTFKQMLRKLDTNRTGRLDWDDFKWSLKNAGLALAPTELEALLNSEDACPQSRTLNYCPFVNFFYNFHNERREALIETFRRAVEARFPALTLEHLIKHFNYHHGSKLELNRFVLSWGEKKPLEAVPSEELMTYFRDVSVAVDCDEIFAELLRTFLA